jgi:ElaB/YqjD/DUF883 family membrane-anchored ribosome-binding protein
LSKNKEMEELRDIDKYVKDMDKRLDELKTQMNVITQKATKKVTERPLLALAVAFVAGMAVGIALSRSND